MREILLFIFISVFFSFSANAYVLSKAETGANIKWNLASEDLAIYVNPIPIGNQAEGISPASVMTIFDESLAQWDQYTSFDLKAIYTTSSDSSKNQVFFTSNAGYFGSGVLAITEINYNVETGAISSADIIVNESAYNVAISFTDDETQSGYLQAYLGDVFTHELGHFLGLSHSEVIGSSMVYSIFKNQHTVHSDDYLGVLDIYNKTLYPGQLSGKVVGGDNTEVFGAHVLLLSSENGQVVQSQISDENGAFHFKNLELDKSYYFYVTPFKQINTISNFYSTVVADYCQQGEFKGSFFTQCGPRSKGRPQGFALTSNEYNIDVGQITIRCDENLVTDYLAKKLASSDREYELNPNLNEFSQVFVGMFLNSEMPYVDGDRGSQADEYTLDLRSLDFGYESPSSYFLKLNLLSSGLSSMFDFEVEVQRDDQSSATVYSSSSDETGKKITDLSIDLALSSSASDNLFSIKVYPVKLSTQEKYEIFSTSSNLGNEVAQYTLNTQVGSYTAGSFVPYELYAAKAYDDNSLCTEGSVNFTTQAYTPLSAASNAAELKKEGAAIGAISCATIDIDNDGDNSGGPMSFALGFMVVFLLSRFSQIGHRKAQLFLSKS